MLFEPKSTKYGHWNPPNFRKIDAKGTAKAKLPPRLSKSTDFIKFDEFWDSKLEPKIMKIRFENEVVKTIAFGSEF